MSFTIWLEIQVDTGGKIPHTVKLWEEEYTTNVMPMYHAAGCYRAIRESNMEQGHILIDELENALAYMISYPDEMRAMEPAMGWGSYEGALSVLGGFLEACKKHPLAYVREQ